MIRKCLHSFRRVSLLYHQGHWVEFCGDYVRGLGKLSQRRALEPHGAFDTIKSCISLGRIHCRGVIVHPSNF